MAHRFTRRQLKKKNRPLYEIFLDKLRHRLQPEIHRGIDGLPFVTFLNDDGRGRNYEWVESGSSAALPIRLRYTPNRH